MATTLRVDGISKRFGGLAALSDVTMEARPAAITGLIGQNGAGKTTLINVISGQLRPDAGRVFAGERELTGLPAWRIPRAGVVRSFQQLRLFPNLSARDNVVLALGEDPGESLWRILARPLAVSRHGRRALAEAEAILDRLGLADIAGTPAALLSYGLQKLVSLARCIASGAGVVMLDEPTSGLAPDAVGRILDVVRGLRAEGRTVLLVEHDMDVLFALSDWIVVMNQGQVFAQGRPDEVRANAGVRDIYFGNRVA